MVLADAVVALTDGVEMGFVEVLLELATKRLSGGTNGCDVVMLRRKHSAHG